MKQFLTVLGNITLALFSCALGAAIVWGFTPRYWDNTPKFVVGATLGAIVLIVFLLNPTPSNKRSSLPDNFREYDETDVP